MTAFNDIAKDADYQALFNMVKEICTHRNADPVVLLTRLLEHYQSAAPEQAEETQPVIIEEYFPFGRLEDAMLNSPFSSPYPNATSASSNWMISTLI